MNMDIHAQYAALLAYVQEPAYREGAGRHSAHGADNPRAQAWAATHDVHRAARLVSPADMQRMVDEEQEA